MHQQTAAGSSSSVVSVGKEKGENKSFSASPSMFENKFLDSLTRVSPIEVYIIYTPTVTALVYYGHLYTNAASLGNTILWWLAGLLFWTFSEYWLHRVVFHFDDPNNKAIQAFHWTIHGVHHDHPKDMNRLMMPLVVSIPLASLFLLLFKSTCPVGAWMTVGGGFLTGYVAYDVLHYTFHLNDEYESVILSYLQKNHRRHHYIGCNMAYGVSSPLWDFVFGTFPYK